MLSQRLKGSRLFVEATWREAWLSEGTACHRRMMMDGYVASGYTFRDGGQANTIEKIDKHKIH